MKLLFAIKSLNGAGGGAERVMAEVANGLAARGHRVSILTFDTSGNSFYPLSSQVERLDMVCGEAGQSLSISRFISAIPRVRRAVRSAQPDLVIPFMHSTYVPVYFALRGLNVNFLAAEHTAFRHFESRPFQRILRKLVVKRCAASTSVSEYARQSFLQNDNLDSFVVPNPINVAEFAQSISSSAVDPPTVLSVGNLRAEKDYSTLVSAFAEVASDFPDWRLRIVGEGNLRWYLEKQCSQLGLSDNVEFVGFSKNVAAEYSRARFIVSSSIYESFGLVAAEALASSRAVLAFDDCGGLAEIVTNEVNGLLVFGARSRAERTLSLAEGLRRLMSDSELCSRLGNAGPASVARYDLSSVLDRWEEVIMLAITHAHRSER